MDKITGRRDGQESDNDSPPELRHFWRNEQIWEELVFHGRPRMKLSCANEWNVSHLQNLVDRNLVLRTVLLRLLTDTLATSRTALTERTKRGY